MIGAGKAQMAGVAIPPAVYSVSLNPGEIDVLSGNGSASSPLVRSTVLGGTGPFTYQWTITGSDISINDPESEDTTFYSGGFNTHYRETATLTVTDTGNGNAETDVSIIIDFDFETGGF